MNTESKTENVNYTDEMVQILKDHEPMNYEKALSVAEIIGRKPRSIIAKCKREGIEYISKPPAEPKKSSPTKLEIVEKIAEAVGVDNLTGLEKATGIVLNRLLDAVNK